VTRVLIEEWGSKSAAAARLNVSRPVLYDRIARIERALGTSLDDPEVRTSLHVALLADEAAGQAPR
jgi:purine catabolism regulator